MDDTLERIDRIGAGDLSEYEMHLMVGGGTRGGPVLHHGQGVRVWDIQGKEYIDCTSQSWALYLGYNHEEFWAMVREQTRLLTHTHQGFDTLPRLYLAKRLTDIAPKGLNRVSFSPSSALALEAGMKLALKNVPGSAHFITLWDGYHGTTLGVMGASWISTRSNGSYVGGSRFLPLTSQTVRVPNPYCYRCYFNQKVETCDVLCAKMLELTILKGVNGPPAGVILEPLQGSGGMIPLPQKYLKRVREICDEYSVPLIFDEIQTYMRMGTFFGAQYFDVTPDIIALGKAVGGGLPLGATILRDGMNGFQPDSEELHTFANNSLSMVGGAKLIEIVERDKILENATKMGAYLRRGLEELQKEFPEIGDIRQAGLHIGIELVADPIGKRPLNEEGRAVRDAAMKRGVLLGLAGVMKNLLKIKPPLIITTEEADVVLEVLSESLTEVLRPTAETAAR